MAYPSSAVATDWLSSDWSALYHGMRPQSGGQGYTNYWKGGQASVWNDYLGKLGSMALSGQTPNLSTYDFLNQYDWRAKYMQQDPRSRGVYQAAMAPNAKWDIWGLSRQRSY